MRNPQKNLNIIWHPPISRQPPPILPTPPFSSKNFQTPQFPSILKKLNPSLYEGGGRRTMTTLIDKLKLLIKRMRCKAYLTETGKYTIYKTGK